MSKKRDAKAKDAMDCQAKAQCKQSAEDCTKTENCSKANDVKDCK